jgi:hypothetical protein
MQYTPDNWVVIKVDGVEQETFYKVVAGWSGGYLDGNSWRINSGITKVEVEGDYYLIYGSSGSVYKCHKEANCVRMNIAGVLKQLNEMYPGQVEVMPEGIEWEKFFG